MAVVGVALLAMAAAVLLSAAGKVVTAGGFDQTRFHYPSIEALRAQLPCPNVVDVQTATTPLFHLVVAAVSVPLGSSLLVSNLIGAAFGAALMAGVMVYTSRIDDAALRWSARIVVLGSGYLWQSTLWLNTDAATALWVAAVLVALPPARTRRTFLLVGLFAALAVATRQTAVWVLLPVAVTALTYRAADADEPLLRSPSDWLSGGVLVRGLLGCLPAIIVLAVFVGVWGGLTPPAFQERHTQATGPSAISYLFTIAAVFFVPLALATWTRARRPRASAIVGLAAALPAILWPVHPGDPQHTGGMVWRVLELLPVVADRSLGLVAGAFVGGAAVWLVVSRLERRTALVIGVSLVGLAVVLIPGTDLYQRYVELPLLLLWAGATVGLVSDPPSQLKRRWPIVMLAAVQLALFSSLILFPLAQ